MFGFAFLNYQPGCYRRDALEGGINRDAEITQETCCSGSLDQVVAAGI